MGDEFREYCDSRAVKAEAPGNTSRSFLITSYDVDHVMDVINAVKNRYTSLTYIIACHEICPTTGRHHNHIYTHFNNSIRVNAFRNLVRPHHVDKCRGTPQQCIDYVMKDVTDENPLVFEEGEPPHQGRQLTANDLRELSREEIVEIDPTHYRANLGAREELLNPPLTAKTVTNTKKMEVYYLYGPSGCGKSTMAAYLLKEHMEMTNSCCDEVKFKNDFWLGIKGSKCAWYDEFRDSDMKPSEFISFIDYRAHEMNIKGGSSRNNYTFIVITSVQGPNEIYRNVSGEPRAQWIRRIKWINMDDPMMKKCLDINKYINYDSSI